MMKTHLKHTKTMQGWGRVIAAETGVFRPEYLSDVSDIIANTTRSLLPYGCGRSYGDAALNAMGDTILTTRLNRFISFDASTLVLECESGVTLREIQQTFLPRGVGLLTSPGTSWVTVGGAIANDVHGKNHDRVGSFSRSVLWFELVLAQGDTVRCSRAERPDLFYATIGGVGLTGLIVRVGLQLKKQPMAVLTHHECIETVEDLLAKLQIAREKSTYSVAWLDLMSDSKKFGRSILSTAEPDEVNITLPEMTSYRLPSLCGIFLNSISMRCFNEMYYRRMHQKSKSTFQNIPEFLYPLDKITYWNALYRKGFYQFQCVIPDVAATAGITDILNIVRSSTHRPYLTVLKTLGGDGEGLMSFSMSGITIAMDFPNQKDVLSLLKKLETATVSHHGRIYLAKDACLSAANFSVMYPRLSEFRAVLDKVDPTHQWQSLLSQRLQIRDTHG